MNVTITPHKLTGTVPAVPSKSCAHRILICAALADAPTELICSRLSRDIEATAACLEAMGAGIEKTERGLRITPIVTPPASALLPCGESGSTLRFLLPVAGALGIDATFLLEGRLGQRPLSPLREEMERMGCRLSRPDLHSVRCEGKLLPGNYRIDGSVSSQFITGLLFALPLISGETTLEITGSVQSKPYLDITKDILSLFKAPHFHTPGVVTAEGDWSNGAFFLGANALGSSVTVTGLREDSLQGDRAIRELLPLKAGAVIDAGDIPDLVPILAIVAGAGKGAEFKRIQRLRIKESDRVASVIAMLEALGGSAKATEDTLTVFGTGLRGGTVDSCGDHRIAMSAAIAATVCRDPVTVLGAEAVEKSYPTFWEDYQHLGGII